MRGKQMLDAGGCRSSFHDLRHPHIFVHTLKFTHIYIYIVPLPKDPRAN